MNVRRVAILALIPIGLALVGILILLQATPRVVAISPAPGAIDMPARTPLELTFSRPMIPESVTEHLTFDPPQRGNYEWNEDTLTFTPENRWTVGTSITVTLRAGARAQFLRLPVLGGEVWSFAVERLRLAYLWPHDEPANVYSLEPGTGEIQALTTQPNGVLDFSLHPRGSTLYFSAYRLSGASDIYTLNRPNGMTTRLIDCSAAICRAPQVSPDGGLMAYQRTPIPGTTEAVMSEIRLRQLEEPSSVNETTVAALSQPSDFLSWSSTGLLGFYDTDQEAIAFYDPETGIRTTFPNLTGAPGDWSPRGDVYIAPELLSREQGDPENSTQPSHLIQLSVAGENMTDLTGGLGFEDADPAFTPDGTSVAFARKYLDLERWTPGRQLWLMRPDGAEARPLTSDPLYNHTDFAWREDGSQLVFTRFNQVTLTDPPEIWLINADGSDPLRLVIGGYDPQWIP